MISYHGFVKSRFIHFSFLALVAMTGRAQDALSLQPLSTGSGNGVLSRVELIHDVEIGMGGNRALHADIARPKDPPSAPMAAVLVLHGGGWSGGTYKTSESGEPDPTSFYDWLFLAAHGYFVASVEYRLSGEARWPAQIEDCKLGVRWLRANAAKYHIDPNRIGCWGNSAGAHLAACLGTMHQAEYEGHGGYPGVSSRVQAVVDYCGPVDFTSGTFGNGSATVSDEQNKRDVGMLTALFGVSFKEQPQLWTEAGPIRNIHPGDPPFLIVHGERDEIVSVAQARMFAAALRRATVPVQLVIVKGNGHNFGPIWRGDRDAPTTDPEAPALKAGIIKFFAEHL